MRKIALSILIYLLTSVSVGACNYIISNFGDSKEDLMKDLNNNIPPNFIPDQFGGETNMVPIEVLCEGDDFLSGTMVHYLFVDNKLVEVKLERFNIKNDAKLMDYAMEKFGKFDLPIGIGPKQNFIGNHFWKKGNREIEYISTNIHDGHVEMLAIVSMSYSYELSNYYEKVGKWLDEQKY